jgi:hypothetical protein
MFAKENASPPRRSVKFYARESASDPYIYQGSVNMLEGDVNYEGWAHSFALEDQHVLAIAGDYAYTFFLKQPSEKAA